MCFLPPVCSGPRPDGTLFISGQAVSSRGGSTSLSSDNYFSRCQSLTKIEPDLLSYDIPSFS